MRKFSNRDRPSRGRRCKLLRFHSVLRSLPVLLIMSALAVSAAGGLEQPKCELCTPPSRVAQLLAANKSSAETHRATAVSHEQRSTPANNGLSGMVWIPGGEFSMGAVMNGSGSSEMPMAPNDAGPIQRVSLDVCWMAATTLPHDHLDRCLRATSYGNIS